MAIRYGAIRTKNSGPSKTITKQVTDRQLNEGSNAISKRSPHIHALKLKGRRLMPHGLRRIGATLMTMLGGSA